MNCILARLAPLVSSTILLAITLPSLGEPPTDEQGSRAAAVVQVANLVYGSGKSSVCFASGYLELLARETDIKLERKPLSIELGSSDLFRFPFAVMTGEGAFSLTDRQVQRLRDYLQSGGFIMASAGCSSGPWNTSFRREFARAFPDARLVELNTEHEIFRMVFNVTNLQTKSQGRKVRLFGMELDGRLSMVYSPEGLNDTGNAGGGCCCCGGNEIRNAKYINANVLAYALLK